MIRAIEHLSNTPRQIFIMQGLGYPLPEFAHLPYVAEPGSQNKLSKRKIAQYLKNPDFKRLYDHGLDIAAKIGHATTPETFNPVIVDFYRVAGYLPDAIINYLLLLGWSLDDTREDFSRAEMIELFTLERVNKSPASFDPQKLWAFEDRHMRGVPVEQQGAGGAPLSTARRPRAGAAAVRHRALPRARHRGGRRPHQDDGRHPAVPRVLRRRRRVADRRAPSSTRR